MKDYSIHIIIGLLCFIIGFGIADTMNVLIENKAHTSIFSHHDGMPMDHMHKIMNLSAENPPKVELIVNEETKGWNLQLITNNLMISPEKVNADHVDGEGHAHLYIDGVKATRIYSEWFHVPREWMNEGDHNLTVTLSSNNHHDYAIDGKVISDSQVISVN